MMLLFDFSAFQSRTLLAISELRMMLRTSWNRRFSFWIWMKRIWRRFWIRCWRSYCKMTNRTSPHTKPNSTSSPTIVVRWRRPLALRVTSRQISRPPPPSAPKTPEPKRTIHTEDEWVHKTYRRSGWYPKCQIINFPSIQNVKSWRTKISN